MQASAHVRTCEPESGVVRISRCWVARALRLPIRCCHAATASSTDCTLRLSRFHKHAYKRRAHGTWCARTHTDTQHIRTHTYIDTDTTETAHLVVEWDEEEEIVHDVNAVPHVGKVPSSQPARAAHTTPQGHQSTHAPIACKETITPALVCGRHSKEAYKGGI